MEGHKKETRQQFGQEGKAQQEVIKFILKPDTGCTGGEWEWFRVQHLRQRWTRSNTHITKPLISRLAWPKEKTYFPWIFGWREADTLHGGIWNLDGSLGLE